jgi:hypothetical protein
MLGDAVLRLHDATTQGDSTPAAANWSTVCAYDGVGSEGGPYTEAVLQDGGRLVKVLGHAEMASQAQDIARAWWRRHWEAADVIVFNMVGHHLRTLDGSFAAHSRLVSTVLHQMERHTKAHAHLIMRTSNVGHVQCEAEFQPLRSRSEAWRRLGGWRWRAPSFTPTYFGAPRDGADKYDWRAPPIFEREWLQHVPRSPLASRFSILNVSHVDMRSDGHVANAMRYHTDRTKATAGRDCLHYCLPGPADAWTVALYNLLLNNPRFAVQHARESLDGETMVETLS